MPKNKKWSAKAKFEIALRAAKGETTLSDICSRYQVSPSQVHAWKKQLTEQGPQLFEKSDKKAQQKAKENEKREGQLYEKIGQLTIERDYLKKNWEKYQETIDQS